MTNPIPPLLTNCLALLAIYYFIIPPPALGYFDLGTGTYMVQMLLGMGAAIWLSMRTSWIRIGRKKKQPASDNNLAAETPTVPGPEIANGESAKSEG